MIYTLDTDNRVRTWHYEIQGSSWRTVSGLKDGRSVTSAWTVCKGKQGRTDDEQAVFEGNAERRKKLDRDYRESANDLSSIPRSPMLAQDFYKQSSISYPVYSQPKLDGIRALISRDGAISRDFQPHYNIEHITRDLGSFFNSFPDVILDGELYNHDLRDDFNTISSNVRKKNVGDVERALSRQLIQYHIYDIISPSNRNYAQRLAFLRAASKANFEKYSHIRLVETVFVAEKDQLDEEYALYLDQGYEGQIVRTNSYYEHKRSKYLLKRKEFITEEFVVADIVEGIGNWDGYAKSIEFLLPSGEKSKAGLRGNKEFARDLLRNKAWYIGGSVTIRYFTPTPDGIPRFAIATDFNPEGRKD